MNQISFLTVFEFLVLLQTLPCPSLPCKLYQYNLLITNYSKAYF